MGLLNKTFFALLNSVESRNRKHSLVGGGPFFDPALFPWSTLVAADAGLMQAELRSLLPRVGELPSIQDIAPGQAELNTDTGWKTFFFYMAGTRVAKNCERCPATERALLKIPGMVAAFYSILAPGKRLAPHRGPYNGVLRYHLGLAIPAADASCAIRVGGETRNWTNGGCLIFDDTHVHEAWNMTDEYRAVLFVDFKRPLARAQSVLNDSVLWLAAKTPIVSVAVKNQANWEHTFYP